MAGKISQYTADSRTKFEDTDLFDISVDGGGGAWSTKSITGAKIRKSVLEDLDISGNEIVSASNGDIKIVPNGTGSIVLGGNSIQPTELKFMEDSDNGTNYVSLKSPSTLASSTSYTLPSVDGTTGQVLSTDGSGILSWATASGGGGGTPAGSDGQIQFNDSGSFGADSALHWDNTNKRLGVGASPASTVRLDVRAQGALSTDIAFRVRNSANTMDILNIAGNGDFYFSSMATTTPIFDFAINDGGNRRSILRIVSGGSNTSPSRVDFQVPFSGGGIGMNIFNQLTGVDKLYLQMNRNNFCFGSNTIATATTDRRVIYINNGTAPSASVTDGFKMYSADITAGNAAPHFRTENGSIIKIYQETTGVAAAALVGGGGTTITDTDTFGGYTLQQIAQALKNLGILA